MNPLHSAECRFSDMSLNLNAAAIFRQSAATAHPLLRLNALMDETIIPYEVNEEHIGNWVNTLETAVEMASPIYWLILIRLNEAALLCAGNYVDNCEFSAAGDLLANPREIKVHSNDARPPVRKWRHGRLSDQFRINGHSRKHTIETIKNEYQLEITRPPILPYLFRCLKDSGRIARPYLAHTDRRMRQITDAISFLAGWQIFDAADLHRRTRSASPETQLFITSHLCHFDNRIFIQAGNAVRHMTIDPSCPCELLSF